MPEEKSTLAADVDEKTVFLKTFGNATGQAATGVTVVATDGVAGRAGQTVSAMSTVSYNPPMVLVCVSNVSPLSKIIDDNAVFTVNVLGTQHDHLADTFAGRPWPGKDGWDFTCGNWGIASSGAPRVEDAIASFDCELYKAVPAGSHIIFIGTVTAIETTPGIPLVYTAHQYNRPQLITPSTFHEYPDARPLPRVRKAK